MPVPTSSLFCEPRHSRSYATKSETENDHKTGDKRREKAVRNNKKRRRSRNKTENKTERTETNLVERADVARPLVVVDDPLVVHSGTIRRRRRRSRSRPRNRRNAHRLRSSSRRVPRHRHRHRHADPFGSFGEERRGLHTTHTRETAKKRFGIQMPRRLKKKRRCARHVSKEKEGKK
jgi:hypothetical protein